MSVIVKTPQGKYLLMTKGADNIISGRSKTFQGTDKATVDSHLRLFSEDGLRTLMLAVREVKGWLVGCWLLCKRAGRVRVSCVRLFHSPTQLLHTRHPTNPNQLSQSEFDGWFAEYQKASAAIHGRVEAMGAAAEKIEKDLTVRLLFGRPGLVGAWLVCWDGFMWGLCVHVL